MKLYHYTTFESFLKIWISGQLLFSEVKNVNDVFEKDKGVFGSLDDYNYMKEFKDVLDSYRQISLCQNYSETKYGWMSTMMWGHYGAGGKGVCIEIDYDKLNIPNEVLSATMKYEDKNRYVPLKHGLKTENEMRAYIEKNAVPIFFTKNKDWEGENEYRLISYKHKALPISNAISKIIVYEWNTLEAQIILDLVKSADKIVSYIDKYCTDDGYREFRLVNLKSFRETIEFNSNKEERKQKFKYLCSKFGFNTILR